MNIQELFEASSVGWAGYNEYMIVVENGEKYVTSAISANLRDYDPLENPAEIVIDALNVGLLCIKPTRIQTPIEKAILEFCAKYGLLGFMCALLTTPDFWEYETVYLPKNPVIKADSLPLKKYEKIFFPQVKEEMLTSKGKALAWLLGDLIPQGEPLIGVGERENYKAILKFSELPFAQRHGFKCGYAEPYEWLKNQFRDWASMLLAVTFYYEETDATMRELHRRAMNAISGVAPHYRVALTGDIPTLKWDFHSLLQTIQLLLSIMLTDANKPLRICPECEKAFYTIDSQTVFCSHDCKNRYNVRKNRKKQDVD